MDFRSFLSESDLFDLKHSGESLSWRGIRYSHVIRCRLDRAIANSVWTDLFPSGRLEYLRFKGSDHRPIVTYFAKKKKKTRGVFRYDRRLKNNAEVTQLIKECWNREPSFSVSQRIAICRKEIVAWSREKQRNSQKLIEQKKMELEQAMVSPENNDDLLAKINLDLTEAYKLGEGYWKQRSRIMWLCLGDQNSGFFHAVTKKRRARNCLSVIEDESGNPVFEDHKITEVISAYFHKMFHSDDLDESHTRATVTEALSPCVSEETNLALIAVPSLKEIHDALMGIHADKVPGPEDFSASFFQSHWDSIGQAIISKVQGFFQMGTMPTSINETFISLILKITGAKKVS